MRFEIENGVLIKYEEEEGVTSITIPNSVTSIGDCAFYGCKSLTSVTIPDSVTSIGYRAFEDCSSLTSITIPNSVTSIEDYAFYGCISLTSITMSDNVTIIGEHTFEDCSSLTSITIPNSVTSIGDYAFSHCNNLISKQTNYKAFDIIDNNIMCMDYTFKPNEWAEEITEIELCKKGYHFCTNLFEIFNYYSGIIDKDIAIYECEVGGKVIHEKDSSKCVTNMIKPVKRLYQKDIVRILTGE